MLEPDHARSAAKMAERIFIKRHPLVSAEENPEDLVKDWERIVDDVGRFGVVTPFTVVEDDGESFRSQPSSNIVTPGQTTSLAWYSDAEEQAVDEEGRSFAEVLRKVYPVSDVKRLDIFVFGAAVGYGPTRRQLQNSFRSQPLENRQVEIVQFLETLPVNGVDMFIARVGVSFGKMLKEKLERRTSPQVNTTIES